MSESTPAASVVVFTYNGRRRIDGALEALREQDLGEPYEVIVSCSGDDGCAAHVRAQWPDVRLVASTGRLGCGAARNRGAALARGVVVAFLEDDVVPRSDWLRRRVALHRAGFDGVGGAITNGTPRRPVGSAGYFLEYSALLPSRWLASQDIPHSLSYSRALLERLGPFPEDIESGEDTVYNRSCVEAGARIGYDPEIQGAHRNPTSLRAFVRHQYGLGRGMAQCVHRHGLRSVAGPPDQSLPVALVRVLAWYPSRCWWLGLRTLLRRRRTSAAAYVALTPLVWVGAWASALGVWAGWVSARRG